MLRLGVPSLPDAPNAYSPRADADLRGAILRSLEEHADAIRQLATSDSYSWSLVTGTPTTLSGYGITDAYTEAEVDALLSGVATEAWVTSQGYLTSAVLAGYATEAWVTSQGYLDSSSLTGYATEAWVTSQGYVPPSRTITSGDGLTGGGTLAADKTLAVGAGTGITVGADTVSVANDVAIITVSGSTPTGSPSRAGDLWVVV